jgi:hypothetical protein
MAAVGTITEISVKDMPMVLNYGTHKKRVMILVRVTTSAVTETLNLATYVPGLQDIEGLTFQTNDDAVNATTATWSTTTLTFAGHAGGGVVEMGVIGTM